MVDAFIQTKAKTHSRRMTVALTGGGTAGHVIPHLALIPYLEKKGWDYFYIGSSGFEKKLLTNNSMEFYTIQAGKLRRYFSWANFTDLFKIFFGFLQSLWILWTKKPSVVFSKGGFVSVPVALAAYCLRIPVVSHESDLTPGLANKIITPFACKILCSFPKTLEYISKHKAHYTGTPVRDELKLGEKELGAQLCGFELSDPRPVILVMGGSQGAQKINDTLSIALPELLQKYRIVHLAGAGKEVSFQGNGYRCFSYVDKDLKHLFALATFVVSRAGANSIFEFLSLQKPMLLIPLEQGSRGDQIQNANYFASNGWALVLREKDLTSVNLQSSLEKLQKEAEKINASQAKTAKMDPIQEIIRSLEAEARSY